MGYGRFINSYIKSIGRADIPTPPNNNNKNHPKNAIEPIQKIGKETFIFMIVL